MPSGKFPGLGWASRGSEVSNRGNIDQSESMNGNRVRINREGHGGGTGVSFCGQEMSTKDRNDKKGPKGGSKPGTRRMVDATLSDDRAISFQPDVFSRILMVRISESSNRSL